MKIHTIVLFIGMIGQVLAGQAQSGAQLVDRLQRELQASKPDTNRVKLLIELGNELSYYQTSGAMPYAQRALQLSRKLGYTTGEARAHYLFSILYLDLNQLQRSKAKLDTAERLFARLRSPAMLGRVHNAKGNWYYLRGDLWHAADQYGRAIRYFHTLRDTVLEIIPYQNLIAALGETRNHEQAIARSKRLLKIVQQRRDSLQMAYSYYYLINNHLALEQWQPVQHYVAQLRPLLLRLQDNALLADAYHLIGLYCEKRQNYAEAREYYQLALDKAQRSDFQNAQYHHALGRVALKTGEMSQARRWLWLAKQEAEAADSRDVAYHISATLSEWYAKMGDFAKAYEHQQIYNKLNDSILLEKNRQYTSYLEAAFKNSEKEGEILRLRTSELQQAIQLKQRNSYLVATGGLVLLLSIFLGIKSRHARIQRQLLERDKALQAEKINSLEKTQQVVSLQAMINGQETERSRIARDLHDGLGGLFSTVKMYFSALQHEQPAWAQHPLFQKSMELTHNAAEELRRIAHDLMPEVLIRLGLINALEDWCQQINAAQMLKVNIQAYGMEQRLAANTEMMLYRIVQELLNNIIKHAQATQVIIQFNRHAERLSIIVEDNGKGFDQRADQSGIGLSTIKSRVDYLNGALSIDSEQGVGTTVMMEFVLMPRPLGNADFSQANF